jgi:hypothetical protein
MDKQYVIGDRGCQGSFRPSIYGLAVSATASHRLQESLTWGI